jgi:predicted permease
MKRIRTWIRRVAGVFQRARRDADLAAEIESHLQLHTDENVRRGMSPEAARRDAVLRLGSVAALTEEYRARRGLPLLEQLVQDLRYAARTMRRSPAVTVVAAVTLALGVAGPTVMFAMMKAWILDPLPFPRPDTLADIRMLDTTTGAGRSLNAADFLDLTRSARSFERIAAYRAEEFRLTGADRADRVRGARVTTDFFQLLGPQPVLGRVFGPIDRVSGTDRVVVISRALWQDGFGGDPAIVGRSIRVDGEPHTVIGVLPESFHFTLLGRVALWAPLVFTPEEAADRRPRSLVGIGRLGHGTTVAQAGAELRQIADQLAKTYPETNAGRSVRVWRLADEVRRHHDAGFLLPVIFAMVCCVLLVACVNVTSVMLARASARRHEMAVRLALGASRGRIVQQWLVEHVVLFVAASAAGIGLAVYGADWVTSSIPDENRTFLRNFGVVRIDAVVAGCALAAGALCGVVFGWLPAWAGATADVTADLRDGAGRTTAGGTGNRLRAALVASEVALALGLLISAALLVQTAQNVTRADLGFDPRHLLTFELALDDRQYGSEGAVRDFYERLAADLASRPGVADAAVGSFVPFGYTGDRTEFFLEGQPDLPPSDAPMAALNYVSATYSRTLGLRVIAGRPIGAEDGPQAPNVVQIGETLARRHFGAHDPIGKRLRIGRGSSQLWTIVGVVRDVRKYDTVSAPEPELYVPLAQHPVREVTVVVRAQGDPAGLVGTARAAVAALDPAEPLSRVFTMDALVTHFTAPYTTTSGFVLVFGLVTLVLAAVGVYGVISYAFSQRTREIGIRMALGARRGDVARLVLGQVRLLLLAGLAPGLLLAWSLGRALQSFLVGVTPTDWRVYLAMCLLLAGVAVVAALEPARRATAIHPVDALRYE